MAGTHQVGSVVVQAALAALLGHAPAVGQELEPIKVATFNLQQLGRNVPLQVPNAAKVIPQFDLVAIQEGMNFGGGTAGPKAIEDLVTALGAEWRFVLSAEANGTATAAAASDNPPSFEFYAFVWNGDRLRLVEDSAHLWDERTHATDLRAA